MTTRENFTSFGKSLAQQTIRLARWSYYHPRIAIPLWTAAAIGFGHVGDFVTYSDGSAAGRQGYVTKFSYKGDSRKTLLLPLCKSWEGQLTMGNFRGSPDGSTSNTFEFSVLNQAVRDKVIDAYKNNRLVSLEYNQTYSHWSCKRDTDYIITDVVPLQPREERSSSSLSPMPVP